MKTIFQAEVYAILSVVHTEKAKTTGQKIYICFGSLPE